MLPELMVQFTIRPCGLVHRLIKTTPVLTQMVTQTLKNIETIKIFICFKNENFDLNFKSLAIFESSLRAQYDLTKN